MTSKQIALIDKCEEYASQGYLIDTRWAFIGYECTIWILGNDHDIDLNINKLMGITRGFKSRWDAIDAALEYLNNNKNE